LIQLDVVDLVLALGMIAIAIGLSAWEQLGLELSLALASARTILQLLVLGYLLAFVFALDNPWAVMVF
jgi:putative ABC transport system permease protein